MMWIARSFPHKIFYGTDVDAQAIGWCRRHLSGHFNVNSSFPPLSYPDSAIDCAYAISVFTHLSEEHQVSWLWELRRVIKPGGVLLLTLHAEASRKQLSSKDLGIFCERGFLFKTSSKLRGIVPDWYHTAFHSREYALGTFSKIFEPLAYIENGFGHQDLVILERSAR